MQDHYSTDSRAQRERLLERLQLSPLSTLQARQARQALDIMHPAARVKELREQGYNIVTHWTVGATGKGKHRIAYYVLLAGSK